ncbi:alpha/beta hydrolase [Williamsia sp.]|uniref:alpha/beta fold hydrolase n=1 Tax=Williamsia sp. TaxID=1872085 RepID=UPI001A18C894|nr:alpha/beta hydrolase [Williamsia sp.]MBJ7290782.1 alpha/beta hydrolase [Williamsia sp.]
MSSPLSSDDTHDAFGPIDGGTYVLVDGHPIWHFVDGDGAPVVLLHGAFAGASSWGAQIPALLAAGWKVYAPERRGHGHSPDTPEVFSYSEMAAETIGYLDATFGSGVRLVGWSDGAVVALLVALRRPDLVDRMVLLGQYYNSSGRVAGPDTIVNSFVGGDSSEAIGFLRAEYDSVSPDGPEHFAEIYRKTVAMIAVEPEIDLATLTGIDVPTLVVQGDRDEVTVEHSLAVVDALANARLAVLPGTHILPLESPDVFNPVLLSFLAGDAPAQWDL